eukprot:21049-Pleurochrysis_carterae.AAC.1
MTAISLRHSGKPEVAVLRALVLLKLHCHPERGLYAKVLPSVFFCSRLTCAADAYSFMDRLLRTTFRPTRGKRQNRQGRIVTEQPLHGRTRGRSESVVKTDSLRPRTPEPGVPIHCYRGSTRASVRTGAGAGAGARLRSGSREGAHKAAAAIASSVLRALGAERELSEVSQKECNLKFRSVFSQSQGCLRKARSKAESLACVRNLFKAKLKAVAIHVT